MRDAHKAVERNRTLLKNATAGVFQQKLFRYRDPRKNLLEGDPPLLEADRNAMVARAKAISNHQHARQIVKMIVALGAVVAVLAFILR